MESIRIYKLITTPYVEGRSDHDRWHATEAQAMACFKAFCEHMAAYTDVEEVTYEIIPHDLTTMAELLNAMNGDINPDGHPLTEDEDARLFGRPSSKATKVRLDGET